VLDRVVEHFLENEETMLLNSVTQKSGSLVSQAAFKYNKFNRLTNP